MIRVLIVDDHPFVRLGVATLLAQADGIAVVGECTDGSEVLDAAIVVEPDVVLMDIQMPGTSGLDATRALLRTRPTARVLMFTASTVAGHIEEAASAGRRRIPVQGWRRPGPADRRAGGRRRPGRVARDAIGMSGGSSG